MCDSDNKTPIVLKTLKEWSRDKSDGSIEIEIVYDDSGDLFFKSCKPSTDVFLDTAKRTIHISEKDGPDSTSPSITGSLIMAATLSTQVPAMTSTS